MARQKSIKIAAGSKRGKVRTVDEVCPVAVEPVAREPLDTANYLTGNLDIHGIEASYREMRGLLASGLPIIIDVSRLDAIDTAGVQLLLAFSQEAERRTVPFNLRGDSTAFSTALDRLGLTSAFAIARRHG